MISVLSKTQTKTNNGGLEAYLKRVKQVQDDAKLQVDVGMVKGQTPAELIKIAGYQEFGTRSIPSRPFMRIASKRYKDALKTRLRDEAKAVMRGQKNTRTGLTALGQWYRDRIKSVINSGVRPANKPATIKAKGHAKTLIDDGSMRDSVTFKVW
jgi:hypothetical protein